MARTSKEQSPATKRFLHVHRSWTLDLDSSPLFVTLFIMLFMFKPQLSLDGQAQHTEPTATTEVKRESQGHSIISHTLTFRRGRVFLVWRSLRPIVVNDAAHLVDACCGLETPTSFQMDPFTECQLSKLCADMVIVNRFCGTLCRAINTFMFSYVCNPAAHDTNLPSCAMKHRLAAARCNADPINYWSS